MPNIILYIIILYYYIIHASYLRGFEKLRKNPKIREKHGNGGGGQAPTRGGGSCNVFFVLFSKKKLCRGVRGWGLTNSSFSRIFGFF